MHPALLSAYAVMLPRLRAAEQLERIYAASIGAGTMKKEDRQPIMRRLLHDIAGGQRQKLSKRQRKSVLASMGLKMITPRED